MVYDLSMLMSVS